MDSEKTAETKHWRAASELPPVLFEVLRKPNRGINPVAIVATVDPDGHPHTAPFGSVRAVTPRLLRMGSLRLHQTYANLCRDGRVVVAVVAPPDIAASISGRARVLKEQMRTDPDCAMLEIEVVEVKNDMVRSGAIESGIAFAPWDKVRHWFDAVLTELEEEGPP